MDKVGEPMKSSKRNLSLILVIIILFSFSSSREVSSMSLSSVDELSESAPLNLSEDTIDIPSNNLVVMVENAKEFEELLEALPEETIVSSFENNHTITVNLDSEEELDEILKDQGISTTESEVFEDQVAYMHKVPNDPYYQSHQWNLRKVNMEQAWDFPLKSDGVVVAVVDSGVTPHFDMRNVINGVDLSRGSILEDTYPGQYSYDGGFHGTAVAGGIASQHNSYGIAGINPKVSIMGVKVFADGTETTPSSVIAAGITWAADHGAHIINLSVGTDTGSPALSTAVKNAVSKGILLVASTGNEGYANQISFPAAYPEVLAVGSSSSYNDNVSSFSNKGAQIDLVAPGESIILPNISRGEGNYSLFNGTSFSAPMVSGAASLLRLVYPSLTSEELKSILKLSARDIQSSGWDKASGYGILDVQNALMLGKKQIINEDETSISSAKTIFPNKKNEGYLKSPLDYSVYKFHLYESYNLEIRGSDSTDLDLSLRLLDANQKELKWMNSLGKGQGEIIKTYLDPGTYYIRVDDASGGSSSKPYTIGVTLQDVTNPQVIIIDNKNNVIPHLGLSKTLTNIEVKDTSSVDVQMFYNDNLIDFSNEVSEEGNYEIKAVDSTGNTTFRSFVLDNDGYLFVNYDAGEGMAIPKSRVYYDSLLTPPEVLKEGYVLKNWYKEPEKINEWTGTNRVKKNLTLFAQWEKREIRYESVQLVSYPTKTTYNLNEPIDLSGLVLKGRCLDKTVEDVPVNRVEVKGFDSDRVGEKIVTLRVEDSTFTYVINVENNKSMEILAGENQFATAAAISFASYKTSMTAILVKAHDSPDALSAGPLAYSLNAPILLTGTDKLHPTTSKELERLGVRKVIIMGGEKAISREVEEDLKVNYGFEVERIAGRDRYQTAVLAGEYLLDVRGIPETVILASGKNFADALSAGSYASRQGFPILLTDGSKLTPDTLGFLENPKIKNVIIVGGGQVVEEGLEDALKSNNMRVSRLSGANRSATSVEVADALFKGSKKAIIANGYSYVDALTAAPYAAKINAPILLVDGTALNPGTESYLMDSAIRQFTIVGGEKAVSKSVKDSLSRIKPQ